MAQGRILNKRIALDKAVNDLSSDLSRLLFTWTIPHLDRDGRFHGDPAIIKAHVMPRRTDVSIEDVEMCIEEWARVELVKWYDADGDRWLEFPAFRDNQPGLRYEKEPPSRIPCPDKGIPARRRTDVRVPSECRPSDVQGTERGRPNGIEVNRSKGKGIVSAADGSTDRRLYHLALKVYESKNEVFDYKVDGPHLKRLEELAKPRDGPDEWLKLFLVAAWSLHQDHDLFRDKAFLPRYHVSHKGMPFVLKRIEQMTEADRSAADLDVEVF